MTTRGSCRIYHCGRYLCLLIHQTSLFSFSLQTNSRGLELNIQFFFEVINIFSKIPTVATHLVRESSHHICIHIRRNIINFCNVKNEYLWIDNYRDRIPVLSITKLKVYALRFLTFPFSPSHIFSPFRIYFWRRSVFFLSRAHLWCLIGIENQ